MTHFFTTPEEAEAWLGDVVERWRLVCRQDVLPGGGRQCFLWPQDLPSLGPMGGVVAQLPEVLGQTLTMGVTGWKAPAFDEPVASEGRRLNQRLSRSLRELAIVPLYAVSFDGRIRSSRPFAWGTPRAADVDRLVDKVECLTACVQVLGDVQTTYRNFAVYAAGNSPCLEEWALGVAEDREVQRWLARLPEPKRQPNLVFAAARWHGLVAPAPYDDLRGALLGDTGRIRATILERATQTNEVGRLATLLPAFASVPGDGPVGLLEVGASAGLCLYPDRWSYLWTTDFGTVAAGSAVPTLRADVSGPAALPDDVPEVAWRGGIDLNPLDAADPETCRWLLTLVWPEHEDRRARLEEALDITRLEPPDVRRGDLLRELPDLVAEALAALPDDGRLLVFHSAVIAYLDVPGRELFAALMQDLLTDPRLHWVSNERPRALPAVTASGPEPPPGRYVLGVDGHAVGHTHQHGRSLHWRG